MEKQKANILLCEDDANLALVICDYLRDHDFAVDHVVNGQEGIEAVRNKTYDLCVLDVMMPVKNGLDMLHELRESGLTMPVLMLSQRSEKEDILAAYQTGCDEYITKPVSMDILLCKIEAWLRHKQIEEDNQETIFQLGNVTFDSVRQYLGDERLSGRENDLLLMLCRKQNQLVDRSHILKSLWQADNYFSSRSLSVYIHHIRHLLSKIKGVRIIAIHGKGYKLLVE